MFEIGNRTALQDGGYCDALQLPSLWAILLLANRSLAEELSEGEIRARDFSYKTATFGMSLADFEQTFSPGLPIAADAAKQTAMHRIIDSPGRVIYFDFTHGRLTSISLILSSAHTGGKDAAEKSVVEAFGRPHSIKDGVFVWAYPNVNRVVGCINDSGDLTIMVSESAPQESTTETQTADSGLGF